MGIWGHEPKDGDEPWDLLVHVNRVVDLHLEAVFRMPLPDTGVMHTRWARVGLVQLLLERGFTIPIDVFEDVRADLKACAESKEWIDLWDKPKAVKKTIARMRKAFDAIAPREPKKGRRQMPVSMRRRDGVQWVHAWNGWPGKIRGSWTGLGEKLAKAPKRRRVRRAHTRAGWRRRRK